MSQTEIPDVQQGWMCPKCKSILSPNVVQCPICIPKPTQESTGINPQQLLTEEC